jgi:hypothetical protein
LSENLKQGCVIKLSRNNKLEAKHPSGFEKMGLNRREMERNYFWRHSWGSPKLWLFILVSVFVIVGLLAIPAYLYSLVRPRLSLEVRAFAGYLPILFFVSSLLFLILSSRWDAIRHWRAIGVVITEIKNHEEREYEGVYRLVNFGGTLHIATAHKTRFGSPIVEFWSPVFPKGFNLPEVSLAEESNAFFDVRHYRIRFRGITQPETESYVRGRVDRIVEISEVISCEGVPSIFR